MTRRRLPWTYRLIHEARPWQVGAALRAVLRPQARVEDVRGLKMWIDPSSDAGYRLVLTEDLEMDMRLGIERILKPGGSCVDLGANEGWYSLLAARAVGRSGVVLCVEPQERLWPLLERNFALNGFSQCKLVPVAVGGEGEAEIALAPPVNTGASSMAVKGGWRRALRKHQKVRLRPLDAIVDEAGIDAVDLLKIDIEGYELNALRSGSKLLRDGRIRNVLMEFHDRELAALGQSRAEILRLFEENGLVEVSEVGGIHHFALKA